MKFHHIGMACEDIKQALKHIKSIYDILSISDIYYDPIQDVQLCLIKTSNGINFELISGSKVVNFVQKRISYYHICYTVADLDEKIEELTKNGYILLSKPQPAILFNGRKVVFLASELGLIELLEG